jgi:hypothetical protein
MTGTIPGSSPGTVMTMLPSLYSHSGPPADRCGFKESMV